MKNTWILLLLLVGLFSCSDDDVTPIDNLQQDQENIIATLDLVQECATLIESGEFYTAMSEFLNLNDGDSGPWTDMILDELDDAITINIGDQLFDISTYAGTYAWNSTTETFDYSDAPADKIIAQMPAKETEPSNNLELIVNNYVDIEVIIDNEPVFLPKSLDAEITVDGNQIFAIDLADVTYDTSNGAFNVPINIDLDVFLAPNDLTIDFTRISDVQGSLVVGFSSGGTCDLLLEADVKLSNADYANLDDEDIEELNLAIEYGSLRVDLEISDFATFSNEDLPIEDRNAAFSGNVFFGNSSVATLELDDTYDSGWAIVFNDGTRQDIEEYLDEEFFDSLEDLFD